MRGIAGDWGSAAIVFVAITAAGYVAERLLTRALAGPRPDRRARPIPTALARSFSVTLTLGSALVGAWVALRGLDLGVHTADTLRTALHVAAIALGAAFVARFGGKLVRLYTQRGDTALPATSIFVNIARSTVVAVGTLMVLDTLGVRIGPLLTALGIGGLALALALQDTLGNLFAGLQIIASKQVDQGDLVRLSTGEEGHIVDVTWRNTTIRRLSNDIVIVPNSVLANSVLTNFSTSAPEHSVTVPLPVSHDADLDVAERIALEVARELQAELPEAVRGFEPTARFCEVTDTHVAMNVILRARSYTERIPLRSEFIRRVHRRFAEEGIEVPVRAWAPRDRPGGEGTE